MIVNIQDGEVEKRYKFGRTLGQGTFATVKLATNISENTKWAVKIIKRSALTSEDEESLKMEIQILQLTNHANIVSVKEVFYCKNYVYLVMDLMTGGELFDRIVTKDHYSEQEAKEALRQIVVAIKYCHEKNIVHRDLKPENILYQSQDEDSILKIADFGLATLVRPNQLMTVACGTPGYVAPEILRGIAYGKEVDIWSIGVILYILLCGFPPFYDDNNKKLFAQIVNAQYSFPDPYWTKISPLAKDLVSKLLIIDPKKRLTADQILEHPWMFEDGRQSNLDHFKPNLKSYNARRRFRSAIRAVQLTTLLRKSAQNGKNQSILAAVEASDATMRSKSIDNSDLANQTQDVINNMTALHMKINNTNDGNTQKEDKDETDSVYSTNSDENASQRTNTVQLHVPPMEVIKEEAKETLSPMPTFVESSGNANGLISKSPRAANGNASPRPHSAQGALPSPRAVATQGA